MSITSFVLLLPLILTKKPPKAYELAELKAKEMPLVDKSSY